MPIPEKFLKRLLLMTIVLTFSLLLFKNPFSERNLIPNLEPYPDTVHYLNPPLSFLGGRGFAIVREDRQMRPQVPFLYSISLIPGFVVNSDVRFFYATNIVLAFLGLLFFYKFLRLVTPNTYIISLTLFLYVTNYFIYWYPNLAMAENLLLPIFTAGLFLLFSEVTPKKAISAGVIGISFYATKYASVSLTATYLGLYFIKIILAIIQNKNFKIKKFFSSPFFKILGFFILSNIISLALFFFSDFLIRGNNIFNQLLEHAQPLVREKVLEKVSVPSGWFDVGYFSKHFYMYTNALLGSPMRFLWDQTPLVQKYIAIPALIGIAAGFLFRKYRFLSVCFTLLLLVPVIAISPFYTTDARYIYHGIPTLLGGFALFLTIINIWLSNLKLKKSFYLILITIFIFYTGTNFQRIKYQIALNLRHAETPWYYMSVKNFNNYFQNSPLESGEKPILITALQPYYIDLFSNANYKLLPLSKEQEFMRVSETVWGPNDYTDLLRLYSKYLKEGKKLYVTNAALGNEGYLHNGFNAVKENFLLSEIAKGCFNTCNVYEIKLKD